MRPTPDPADKVTAERYPKGLSCPVLAEITAEYQEALKQCNSDKGQIKDFYKNKKPAN